MKTTWNACIEGWRRNGDDNDVHPPQYMIAMPYMQVKYCVVIDVLCANKKTFKIAKYKIAQTYNNVPPSSLIISKKVSMHCIHI